MSAHARVALVMPTLLGPAPGALATLHRLRSALRVVGVEAEVWILDNGGVAEPRPGAQVADPGTNLGFGRAVNWWLDTHGAGSSSVVVWNDDLAADELDSRSITACAEAIATWDRRGVAGAFVPSLRHDVRAVPGVLDALAALAGLGRTVLARRPRRHRGTSVTPAMAWVLPRVELDALGGFDEGYPLYFEDVDYAVRRAEVHLAPFEVIEVPGLVHGHSRTAKELGDPSSVVAVSAWSTARWLQQRCGLGQRASGRLIAAALGVRWVVQVLRRRPSGVTRMLAEDYLRGIAIEPPLPARPQRARHG